MIPTRLQGWVGGVFLGHSEETCGDRSQEKVSSPQSGSPVPNQTSRSTPPHRRAPFQK